MSQLSKFGPIERNHFLPIAIAGETMFSNQLVRLEWITIVNSLGTQAYLQLSQGGEALWEVGLLPFQSLHIPFPDQSPFEIGNEAVDVLINASSTPFMLTPFIATQLGVTFQYRVAAPV